MKLRKVAIVLITIVILSASLVAIATADPGEFNGSEEEIPEILNNGGKPGGEPLGGGDEGGGGTPH